MRRVILDSNAVDPLADRPGVFEAARDAIKAGRFEFLYTHVTADELGRIRDPERRAKLLQVLEALGERVPTGAFVLGYSRLGLASLGSDHAEFEALRSENVDHTWDALIASAARSRQCALVTNDHRLAARARDQGIEVVSSDELLAELGCATGAVQRTL